MIPALAVGLLLLLIGVLVATVVVSVPRLARVGWWGLAGSLVLGALVLGRPHETLLAGQDDSAYLCAAATYARADALFLDDEILLAVPVDLRGYFLYAHEGFGCTRDNALNLIDVARARLGPRFQPTFAVLLAGAIRASGSIRGAYWVTPLSALLAAMVIGLLAARLSRSALALPVAVCLFVLNPLVVWHGRMPRPEFFAAFLCVSAGLLLLHARRGGRSSWWLVAGAVGVALAPFFHVTALFVMLPWFVLATWVGRRHLAALLVVHGIGGMGLLAFAAQALWVTDHYGLAQVVRWGLVSSLGNILLVLIGVCEVALLLWLVHARRQESLRVRSAVVRVTGWSVALIVALLLVVLFLLSPPLAGREFDGYEFAYAALTDFRSAAAYLGLPLCGFAVVGVARLLAGRGRRDALLIVLMLLPASLLVGTIYDLFITRYLLVSVVPMFVIGLCGWLPPGWPPMGNRFRAAVPVALIAVLCGFQVWSSWSLYAVRDYDGMTRTLKKLARPVLKDNGILLCQYPRLGAPMQRVYGIPTLTLNRDVHKDTTEQLIGWRAVCAAMPERPAFFMTPFELPEWEGVRFELVEEAALRHYKPRGGLFNPPGRRQREANKHFRLYRMMEEE